MKTNIYACNRLKQKTLRGKLLFPFLLLSGLASAQAFAVPDYTLSLNHAPNYLLDSTVVKGNSTGSIMERISYTYDGNARLTGKNRRDLQMNQSEISTFNYDLNDSLVQKTYASGQSAPTLTALTVMTRNPAKRVAYDTISYSSGPQYTLNSASSYSYDSGGNLSEMEMHNYTGSWSPFNRRQYVRNGAGKITNALFQGWVNSAWENTTQNNSIYNGNNDLTDQVFQVWNTGSSSWTNLSRARFAYTGSHVDTFTTYSWSNGWMKNGRYTYSPAGAVDSVTIDSWNGAQWAGYKRYVRTWVQGKLTSVIEKGFTSSWENAWKYEYTYDVNGNNTVTSVYVYNTPSNPWVLLIVTTHYYTMSTVGITEYRIRDTKIYPVPSAGMLYFDSALPVKSGTVYTAGGQEAIRFYGSSVDLASVVPGLYYVKLLLEDGSFRLVKAVRE